MPDYKHLMQLSDLELKAELEYRLHQYKVAPGLAYKIIASEELQAARLEEDRREYRNYILDIIYSEDLSAEEKANEIANIIFYKTLNEEE